MRWFRSKKQKELNEEFMSYFKLEGENEDLQYEIEKGPGGTTMVAEIKDADLSRWLHACTKAIQQSLGKHPEIINYLAGQFIIAGQKIEFAFLKDFGESPTALRKKAEEENERLKKRIKELEEKYETIH